MEAKSVTMKQAEFYHTYVLRCQREMAAQAGEQAGERFVVYAAADKQHGRDFDNLEQVMDFLLDELFGPAGKGETGSG